MAHGKTSGMVLPKIARGCQMLFNGRANPQEQEHESKGVDR
jgi:hypothetical protein